MIHHAGLIALRRGGSWIGALIRGPSGSGKSDLALRALEAGFRLVADDRVILWRCEGRLYGRAPEALHGRIEVRAVGIERRPALPMSRVVAVVDCALKPTDPPRLPEPISVVVEGVALPVLDLWPFEPSAALKLQCSICHIGQAAQDGYQAVLAFPRNMT